MVKLLFVDSSIERLLLLRDLISEVNIDVAFNGWEGLGAAMMYPPDVILANLVLPVMDGLEMLRLLRTEEKLKNLPVIFFTDPQDTLVEQNALQRGGAVHLIPLPFERETLLAMIQHCLPPKPANMP